MTAPAITRADALQPVLVASHPRSGTHLAMDFLRRQFPSLANWRYWGLPLDHLYLNLERLGAQDRRFSEDLARRIVNRPRRALLKTHFQADFGSSWQPEESAPPNGPWRDLADHAQTIYIVRHPMNVMTSYHQFLSGIDPSRYATGFMQFLESDHWDASTDRLGWWERHVVDWTARPGTLVIRYEDVVKRPEATMRNLAEVLGERPANRMPPMPPKVSSITRTRFSRLLNLSPQSTAIVAERSRFPALDWRKELGAEERAKLAERLRPLLTRFDYSLEPPA
ncbi:sulfotransferase domain-containing protein [Antarctobacter sp.]|uniref:sulfotransferase domain-containing protein n=1 Tax=Antarctobacter sp. TaxID=1872577 RepID=UPI003A94F3F3